MIWDFDRATYDEQIVSISDLTRDEWAVNAIAKVVAGESHWDISSGDSVVIALRLSCGTIRVYDCIIAREAEIREGV